jgi:hypothetical protein
LQVRTAPASVCASGPASSPASVVIVSELVVSVTIVPDVTVSDVFDEVSVPASDSELEALL